MAGLPFYTTPTPEFGYVPRQREMVLRNPQPPSVISEEDMILTPAAVRLRQIEGIMAKSLEVLPRPSNFAARLRSQWHDWWNRRRFLEIEWLDSWQRWMGQYSAETLARMHPNKSKLWVGLTAMKCNQAHATIMDFLLGNGKDKPWGLRPPDLPENLVIPPEFIERGIDMQRLRDELRKQVRSQETIIENQLADADFDEELDKSVLELVITGSQCMKGPLTVESNEGQWEMDLDVNLEGTPVYSPRTQYKPVNKHVPILNTYADMESSVVQESRGIYEELFLTRRGLMDLAMRPGFNPMAVLEVLKARPGGDADILPHQILLRAITGDISPTETKRWRILRWCGEVSGEELRMAGADVPKESLDMAILGDVYFSSEHILYAKPLKGKIPYYISTYTKRGGDIPYGRGLPQLCKSSQDAINASARALLDNMAIASGPMIEVNADLLTPDPGMDPTDIHAWRVWLSSHDGNQGKKAVQIHEVPAYSEVFMRVIDLFRRFMDEESFMPSLTGGMQGVGTTKTATGMSILNTNANKALKQVMRYIDNRTIEPIIEGMQDWNLRYNPSQKAMALGKAFARGSSSLIAKEVLSQRLMSTLQMLMGHPDFKDTNAIRALMEVLGLGADEFVLTEQEKITLQEQGGGQMLPDGQGVPPGQAPPPAGGGQGGGRTGASPPSEGAPNQGGNPPLGQGTQPQIA